jgi:Flp pilus assembly pilin Flp
MDWLTKLYVRFTAVNRGQTMAEYGLILAAVAVACIVAYKALGTDINTLLTTVGADL